MNVIVGVKAVEMATVPLPKQTLVTIMITVSMSTDDHRSSYIFQVELSVYLKSKSIT